MTLFRICIACFVLLFTVSISAQEFQETTKHTAQFSSAADKVISVHNVYGSIEIVGYNGDEVLIEVKKHFKAKNQKGIDQGREEVDIKIIEDGSAVIVYLDSPHSYFDMKKRNYQHREHQTGRRKYKYNFDFVIKVPYNTNVEAYAINDGYVLIKDIDTEEINVGNLNGKITLEDVAGAIDANALNEDIDVTYKLNPTVDSYFNALNGDVNVTVQDGFGAEVFFKSMNGHFYTGLEKSVSGSKAILEKSKNEKKGKFKLSKNRKFQIGSGGPELHFDLLNGNVNLTE